MPPIARLEADGSRGPARPADIAVARAACVLAWKRPFVQRAGVKNIQIIDGADNATFSIFQATDEEYSAIFPGDCDMELVEDLVSRLGETEAGRVLTPLWSRPVLKRNAVGIHGTLFYGNERRREFIPSSKREVDWAAGSINAHQRELFAQNRS